MNPCVDSYDWGIVGKSNLHSLVSSSMLGLRFLEFDLCAVKL